MVNNMDKIIFLDIDGVLNHEDYYRSNNKKFIAIDSDYRYQTFCPNSKAFLNQLIEKTNAKIVISSTWRADGINRMQDVWENEKMSGEIIGITPHFCLAGYDKLQGSAPRGCEIERYLKDLGFYHINYSKDEQLKYMEKSNISNYIIIDDDSDMLYGQKNHFINVLPSPRNKSGFNEYYYNIALDMLSKDIIQLNYED